MNISTLLLGMAAGATSMFAQTDEPAAAFNDRPLPEFQTLSGEARTPQPYTDSRGVSVTMESPAEHRSQMRKARAKVPPTYPVSDQIITSADVPEGRVEYYGRSSERSYLVLYGAIAISEDAGLATEFVFTDDNKVYINEPITYAMEDTWIVGDVNEAGDRITIKGGQPYAWIDRGWKFEYEESTIIMYYLFISNEVVTKKWDPETMQEYDSPWYWQTDDNEIVLVKDGDNWVPENPELTMTLGTWYEQDLEFGWQGYADDGLYYTRITDEVVTPPADLQTEQYSMIWGFEAKWVNFGVYGDKVYVQSIDCDVPGSWSMGTIEGDKVRFPEVQFMGKATDRHWVYLYGGALQMIWDEYAQQELLSIYPHKDHVWEYEPENEKMYREGYVMSSTNKSDDYSKLYLRSATKNPVIRKQHLDPNVKPQAPYTLMTFPYDDILHEMVFTFYAPTFNEAGDYLDPDHLYYQIYLDGELLTFDPLDYCKITEPFTYVPYTFTDGYDFRHQFLFRTVYFYIDGIDRIGVRMAYDYNGTWLYSDIAEEDIPQADVDEVGAAEVVDVRWLDMQGTPVSQPSKGLYIKMSTMSDGTVRTEKVMI